MKCLPLIKRLEMAISLTTSDDEVETVYGIFSQIAKKVLFESREEFYSNLSQIDFTFEKRNIDKRNIDDGKNLSSILQNSINLPETSMKRGYGNKIRSAMKHEYKKIKEFYKNGND